MLVRVRREDPAFIYYRLLSDHYLISMQQVTNNLTPPPGSVPAHSGKLLSWEPGCPVVVNTATLRCSGTNDWICAQEKNLKKQYLRVEEWCRRRKQRVNELGRCENQPHSPPGSPGEAKAGQDATSSRWELDCKCLLRAWLIAWSAVY